MSVFGADGHVHLDTPDTMWQVLIELVDGDAARWRGSVGCWPEDNPPGPARWRIEANDHRGNSVTAMMGDHLVLVYGRLLRLSHDEYLDGQGS